VQFTGCQFEQIMKGLNANKLRNLSLSLTGDQEEFSENLLIPFTNLLKKNHFIKKLIFKINMEKILKQDLDKLLAEVKCLKKLDSAEVNVANHREIQLLLANQRPGRLPLRYFHSINF